MIDPGAVTWLSFVIALVSLDQAAVGQIMVSQPVVGGWIVGLACGDPAGGLAAGAFFQVLCLTELPVGASIPPDGSLAGLIGTALFVTLPNPAGWTDAAVLGQEPALFERDFDPDGFSWVDVNDTSRSLLSFLRYDASGWPLLVVANFTPEPWQECRFGVPRRGRWKTRVV